ncbi:N-myristoyl transferase [Gonapodya prolifera JEL478]|uniref:Glycylpeptide N-tetradecanoyltransferase n=1 Tax=Gonapodya prolifera (strain JEL478) TaxID=1344416 RepID=A0A139AMS6_GONPJ|nr:N-myristoyl transferase [Gonapodya prolifera JEL478]|eukprot:KXS18008.1 N-myristoyl transferase [Gonapodya prolifera JEL478]
MDPALARASLNNLLRLTDQSALRNQGAGAGAPNINASHDPALRALAQALSAAGVSPVTGPPSSAPPPGAGNAAAVAALQAQFRAAAAAAAKQQAKEPKDITDHKFWSTQPVPKSKSDLSPTTSTEGAIELDKLPDEIRQEPYQLPKEFMWSEVDVGDAGQLKELYTLLTENYVEDDDAMFRFDYSAEFLAWALKPPGWLPSWHLGVRVSSNKKLVAFISAIPARVRARENTKPMVEINFLCSHKKLRSKRLAPVLIREITRRVHLTGVFQAVYTGGAKLPTPVSTCRYYHRSLNPRKLVEVGFSQLGRNMTMQRIVKLYKLADDVGIKGWRAMEKKDVPRVREMVEGYLARFELAQEWSEEEVEHWFLPRNGVVGSYVVEDAATSTVTDFISFYSLPSSVIGNERHKSVRAAYLFYYAPKGWDKKGEEADKERVARVKELVGAVLVAAKNLEYDVFNCLTLMENETFMEELKFGKGDGELNYYLYNWR